MSRRAHAEPTASARIAINGDETPVVCGVADLSVYLEEPGNELLVARFGRETAIEVRPALSAALGDRRVRVERTVGETYRVSGAAIVGGRYLARAVDGRIIGALNYTLRSGVPAVLSNLVVREGWRRQGLATELLAQFRSDYPAAVADSSLTDDGAAFLGYRRAPALDIEQSPRRPRP